MMDDDRIQKSNDRIGALTAQQVEIRDQTGATQADANQPQTELADATREDTTVIASPDIGEAGADTVLEDAPGSLSRD